MTLVNHLVSFTLSSAFNHCMALNSLLCADVPLRTYTLTPSGDEMKPASVGKDSVGPDILYDEFKKALSKLKNGKATGIDGTCCNSESIGHMGKHELFEILDIYRKSHWLRFHGIHYHSNRKEARCQGMCGFQDI